MKSHACEALKRVCFMSGTLGQAMGHGYQAQDLRYF